MPYTLATIFLLAGFTWAAVKAPLVLAAVVGGGLVLLFGWAGLAALTASWRMSRVLARIRRLDRDEAPDGDFERAFRDLRRVARGTRHYRTVRGILLRENGKSRDYYFALLAERKREPEARAILTEISTDWTSPLLPSARKALRKE